MEIFNTDSEPYNFRPELQPLFNAMLTGRPIKKITCMGGSINKDNPDKDFTIEDVVVTQYWVSFQHSGTTKEKFDFVDTEDSRGFYMSWVRSFEL